LGREVKICFYNTMKKKFVGNSMMISAEWDRNYEDQWQFDHKLNYDKNTFLARVQNKKELERLIIVFELVLFYQ